MPDRYSTQEIEDVLSSVRRLVSARSEAPAPEKPEEPLEEAEIEQAGAADEKLLLTPALRIAEEPAEAGAEEPAISDSVEDQAADMQPTSTDQAQSYDDWPTASSDTATVADPVETVAITEPVEQAAESHSETSWSDVSDVDDVPLDDAIDTAFREETAEPEDQAAQFSDEPGAETLQEDAASDTDPLAAHAEAEPAPEQGQGGSETADAAADTMPGADDTSMNPDEGAAEPSQSENPSDQPVTTAGLDAVWSLEDRIAELEAAVGAAPDEFEPEAGETLMSGETPNVFPFEHDLDGFSPREERAEDDPDRAAEAAATEERLFQRFENEAPTPKEAATSETPRDPMPEPFAEASEAPPEAAPMAEASDPDPAEAPADMPPAAAPPAESGAQEPAAPSGAITTGGDPLPEDLALDLALAEDMLRDMVGEIVREELQGPLGERITRNVRKLVRREIQRAILTRDLD